MSNSDSSSDKVIGQVKWFNNKAGYGFITVKDGEESKDIFAHYTNLNVDDSQYKYLVQGEYVEFVLAALENGKHDVQATEISGINGGQLMCVTRKLNVASSAPVRRAPSTNDRPVGKRPVGKRPVAPRVKEVETDADGFQKVVSRKPRTKVSTPSS